MNFFKFSRYSPYQSLSYSMKLLLLVSAVLSITSLIQAADHYSHPCEETYNVVQDDDCKSIAAVYGVTDAKLQQWNEYFDPDFQCNDLKTGDHICVQFNKKLLKRASVDAHKKKASGSHKTKKPAHKHKKEGSHKKASPHKKEAAHHKKALSHGKAAAHKKSVAHKKASSHKKEAAHHEKAPAHKKLFSHHKKAPIHKKEAAHGKKPSQHKKASPHKKEEKHSKPHDKKQESK
ncbi:unnamed protein product [Mucor fragilis]